MIDPFKIIAAASEPRSDGGAHIDVEAFIVALITVAKIDGINLETVQCTIATMWPDVKAELYRLGKAVQAFDGGTSVYPR